MAATVQAATDAPSVARDDVVMRVALWGAIVLAVVVRVAFLADKPFWRDEAWVALLVETPMRAVSDGRAAPLGFVWLMRLTAAIPGLAPEVGYRLVPLFCGIALVPLLARLASVLGATRATAVTAAWLAAGLPPFVYYSRELKSYGIDAFLAVLVPLLVIEGFGERPSRRARLALCGVVALAPWVSFGGIFSVGAVLAWCWIVFGRRLAGEQRRDLVLCSLVFLVSFAAAYMVALAPQSASPRLHAYWHSRLFVHGHESLVHKLAEASWQFAVLPAKYLFYKPWPVALVVTALGAICWPRSHRGFLAWTYVGTAALCVVAALMDRYLLASGRHLLFVAPVLVLWTAEGLQCAGRSIGRRWGPALAVAISVVLSLYWSGRSIRVRVTRAHPAQTFRYDVLDDVGSLIDEAVPLIGDGEPLLVSLRCAYAFQFYSHGRLPQAVYCERYCRDFLDRAKAWLATVKGRGWLMIVDGEGKPLGLLLEEEGFTYRKRATAAGVALWELERKRAVGRSQDPPAL